jgi:hypothetical protein
MSSSREEDDEIIFELYKYKLSSVYFQKKYLVYRIDIGTFVYG